MYFLLIENIVCEEKQTSRINLSTDLIKHAATY